MRLILFGGAETNLNQAVPEIKLIGEVIKGLNPRQVLHIPFARITATEPDWSGDWFNRNIQLDGIVYLNAQNESDMDQADKPLIFISGGSDHVNLYNKIVSNPRLLELITRADYIIGESAGSTVLGEYRRENKQDGVIKPLRQLGIIKNTVIMPHYSQWNRQEVLRQLMEETGVKYGLGIDSMTAVEFKLDQFPEEYNKIGSGNIEIKYRPY